MTIKNIATQLTVAAVEKMDLQNQDKDFVIKEVFNTYETFLNLLYEKQKNEPQATATATDRFF